MHKAFAPTLEARHGDAGRDVESAPPTYVVPPAVDRSAVVIGPVSCAAERSADVAATQAVEALARDPRAADYAAATVPPSSVGALRRSPSPGRSGAAGATGGSVDGPDADALHNLRRSGGSALPSGMRTAMESALGADLGRVRVHTGAEAARLSHRFGAAAFTVGQDVVFGGGFPDTRTIDGRFLLAHELAHTQQSSASEPVAHRVYLDQLDPLGTLAAAAPVPRNSVAGTSTDPLTAVRRAVTAFAAAATPDAFEQALTAVDDAVAAASASGPPPDTTAVLNTLRGDVRMARETRDALVEFDNRWRVIGIVNRAGVPEVDRTRTAAGTEARDLSAISSDLRQREIYERHLVRGWPDLVMRGIALGAELGRQKRMGLARDFPAAGTAAERDALAHVENFLMQPGLVRKELDVLDRALAAAPDRSLTDLLRLNEEAFGFSPVTMIPLGILPADVFLALVRNGVLVKDFGAGVAHGELTHRLQWFAISRYVAANPATFPNHTPLMLYRALGSPSLQDGEVSGKTVWGRILDQGTRLRDNWTSPEEMNRSLMNHPDFAQLDAAGARCVMDEHWKEVQQFVRRPATLRHLWAALVKRAAKRYVDLPPVDKASNTMAPTTAQALGAYRADKTTTTDSHPYVEAGGIFAGHGVLVKARDRADVDAMTF